MSIKENKGYSVSEVDLFSYGEETTTLKESSEQWGENNYYVIFRIRNVTVTVTSAGQSESETETYCELVENRINEQE